MESGFLVAIAALALVFFPFGASPFALKQEFALLFFSAALLYWVYRRGQWSSPGVTKTAGLALLFVASAAVSNLAARNPPEAWASLALSALGVLLFLFGHLRLWSPEFPRRFAATVFWTSFPISMLGLLQALLPGRLDFGLQALGKMAAFSTLGNPQFVAAWLVFAIPLYPLVVAPDASRWSRIQAAVVALAALACLLVTRSASGILALAAVCVFALMLRTSGATVRRIAVSFAVLIPAAAAALGWFTHSGRGRLMIWAETVLIWLKHTWFGVGLGQYNLHQLEAQHRFFGLGDWTARFHQNASFVLDAHNQYLQVLAEQGIVGLLLFLALVVVILRQAGKRLADDPLARSLTIAWCGQLVLFLWNAPLFYAPMLTFFWITAGILAPAPVTEPATRLPSRSLKPAAAGLVVVASLFFGAKLRSGNLEKQGDALLEHGPFPAAAERYRDALGWVPQNGYVWEKLALAQYFSGDGGAALESLAEARQRFGDVGILYLEGEILARRGDYTRAIPAFEFIRDAFPQHVTPSFTLGQIFMTQGDKRRAEAEFVRVLNLPESKQNLKLDRKKIAIQRALAFRFLAEIRRH